MKFLQFVGRILKNNGSTFHVSRYRNCSRWRDLARASAWKRNLRLEPVGLTLRQPPASVCKSYQLSSLRLRASLELRPEQSLPQQRPAWPLPAKVCWRPPTSASLPPVELGTKSRQLLPGDGAVSIFAQPDGQGA
jgi:hypothetical protein